MDTERFIHDLLQDVTRQDAARLRARFCEDAQIFWHNTNEYFTRDEYVAVNCEYPGAWDGEVERVEITDGVAVSVARIWEKGGGASFHVTSFYEFREGRIACLHEYWGDDGPAPQWRRDKGVGRPIRCEQTTA